MKRVANCEPSTSGDIIPRKIPSIEKPPKDSILENGKIYFTPIGGITVPRQESEGSLALEDILSDIRPTSSIHFSFMIDFEFLINSYPPSLRDTPITLVVGAPNAPDLRQESESHKNVSIVGAPLPITFGTHHSKMSIMESEDSKIHVIIYTANFTPDDWEFRAQQFYYAVGEKLADIVPSTPFQDDLLKYLNFYDDPLLEKWKSLIENTDFSLVTDRLIFSTPGYHTGPTKDMIGHPRLSKILSENFPYDPNYEHTERCTFIAQCSSIGSLGAQPVSWFRGQFLKSLEASNPAPKNKPPKFLLIFPCVEDIRNSCQGYDGGVSVPYRNSVHVRQKWLQSFMCKWRANRNRRTLAVPHCKTYVKYDKKIPQWQLLTSANLSKAAWGELTFNNSKKQEQLMIRSYEMGVLICDPDRFNIPFDYPCVPYSDADEPFVTDKKHKIPDVHGCIWNPPVRQEF